MKKKEKLSQYPLFLETTGISKIASLLTANYILIVLIAINKQDPTEYQHHTSFIH